MTRPLTAAAAALLLGAAPASAQCHAAPAYHAPAYATPAYFASGYATGHSYLYPTAYVVVPSAPTVAVYGYNYGYPGAVAVPAVAAAKDPAAELAALKLQLEIAELRRQVAEKAVAPVPPAAK